MLEIYCLFELIWNFESWFEIFSHEAQRINRKRKCVVPKLSTRGLSLQGAWKFPRARFYWPVVHMPSHTYV